MKKTILFLFAFVLLAGLSFAEPVDFHEPQNVTITASVLGNTYAANTAWVQLRGSDVDADATMNYTAWRVSELLRTYDFYVAYKAAPQLGEYYRIKASDPIRKRRLSYESASGGIYLKLTFTASHAAGVAADIQGIFESEK